MPTIAIGSRACCSRSSTRRYALRRSPVTLSRYRRSLASSLIGTIASKLLVDQLEYLLVGHRLELLLGCVGRWLTAVGKSHQERAQAPGNLLAGLPIGPDRGKGRL